MTDVKEIISFIRSPSEEDVSLVRKAYEFARRAHEGQERYSGDPYFEHLFQTGKILAELGMSSTTVAAGLLHDSIEDVGVTPDTIREEFGDEILFIVQGVTKLGHIKYHGTNWHTESLRKLFVAMSEDIRVLMVKLSDRLHNMRTLGSIPGEKQRRIAGETIEVYAPIAYRLGIGKLSHELEDLAFPFVYPREYETTRTLIRQKQAERLEELEKFHKSLRKVLAAEGFPKVSTSYRVKSMYSLYKKLKHVGMDIDKIYDLSALRVIIEGIGDCYKILGIIHSNWRPLPGRIKDYIAFPKPNGYQSLHTTVFTGYGGIVEIQIRTNEMHRKAEYGIASHLSYKTMRKEGTRQTFEWIRKLLPDNGSEGKHTKHSIGEADVPKWIKELVEYQKASSSGPEFEQNLKADFFQQRIFVFTPRGDVVDLPVESTPIDFAYAIHSDIGNRMSGSKVNGRLVALDTPLQNGDIVEILTKKTMCPNRKWIDMAKTTMAKRHIRQALQSHDKTDTSK